MVSSCFGAWYETIYRKSYSRASSCAWICRVLDGFCDASSRAPQLSWRWRGTFAIDMSLVCLRTPALTVGSPEGLVGGFLGSLEAGTMAWVKGFLDCFLFSGFPVEE